MPRAFPASLVAHQAAGRTVDVAGHAVFVREAGAGAPVVLMHGIPTSSYLYRKMLPGIAAGGFRAIAFDLLGMGLSAKPRGADYRWSALAAWTDGVIAALAPRERVHLVVHDLSGRVGIPWAIAHPERVASLTIMDTPFEAARFRPPFPVSLFAVPFIRQAAIRLTHPRLFHAIMQRRGVHDAQAVTLDDTRAYLAMLAHDGGRRSFLDILRGDDLRPDHAEVMRAGLASLGAPIQAIWGRFDRGVPRFHLDHLRANVRLRALHELDAGHFLQEEQPELCVRHILEHARTVS